MIYFTILATVVRTIAFFLQIMNNVDKWGIDVFKVAELTNNRPLTATTFTILQVIISFWSNAFW